MNYAIDSDFFRKIEVSDQTIEKIMNEYQNCLLVCRRSQLETNHKFVWYKGKIVVAPENFELGKYIYFQEYENEFNHDKYNESVTVLKLESVFDAIPPVSDSTSEEDFYNLEYFRQKRIFELERNYDFSLVWAVDRVRYLRRKKWKLPAACKRVSAQSGLDYDTIIKAFNARCGNLRWAKQDYEKSRN